MQTSGTLAATHQIGAYMETRQMESFSVAMLFEMPRYMDRGQSSPACV
jgi:hypothetical protein